MARAGNRIFVDVIKLKRDHTGLGWALTSMTGVLIPRGNLGPGDTHTKGS